MNFLEGNLDKFPTYQESEAYKVKHFEQYQNEKDDSCYFLGIMCWISNFRIVGRS